MIVYEIWWRVFLASIVTVVIAKFFGCKWNVFLLFSLSFIGWAIGIILFFAVVSLIELWRERSKKS
ncbi:MAG: hypothetical protein A3J51_02510 [Omnitrophica WOR_2 bacterium RIFCSPHIGHO2_02_FULL_45_21]|nr:MAG: hypothetical protein A3J51_02510 [Omnitrophica WOR_2 bacterium RIFCSPHIGHO2_02_FULL_45_21]